MVHDRRVAEPVGAVERLENAIEVCERFLAGPQQGQITQTAQAQAIRDASLNRFAQMADGAVCGTVLVLAPGKADYVTGSMLGQSITGDHARRQITNLLEGGFAVHPVNSTAALESLQFFEGEPFTAEEAACAFRLPMVHDERNLGLQVQKHRTLESYHPAKDRRVGDSIQLGVNLHRGARRLIEITTEDRLRHSLFIGATGVGKSTMLLSSMLQDARAGRGLALIDPPGELADDFLARFPRERMEDLIIVDFDDRDQPVPLNLLAWRTAEERDLLIDTLYSTILSIYKNPDFVGPVFESNFRAGLRLLLGDRPRTDFTPTLLELPQVFRNAEFRKYLLSTSHDDDVRGAIQEAEQVTSGDSKLHNMAPWINSKFARFLQDSQLRRIVGNGHMALDFRAAMDSGKIIIFKLAQGRLGKHVADMLIAQIVARFRLAAMSLSEVRGAENARFQVIADDNFAQMLSQCRKYALGLVLANQYATQLRESGVLDAVLANVGIIACYRVGAEDARLLAPVFAPTLGPQDLVECPNWQGYIRLHSSRTPMRPVSFHNVPDAAVPDNSWARLLAACSRDHWGVPSRMTDLRIQQRNAFIQGLPESGVRKSFPRLDLEVIEARDAPTSEGVALGYELEELIDKLQRERPEWCAYRDECANAAATDPKGVLVRAFSFLSPVSLDWFLAMAKALVDQGVLLHSQIDDFLGSIQNEVRMSARERERVRVSRQVCFSNGWLRWRGDVSRTLLAKMNRLIPELVLSRQTKDSQELLDRKPDHGQEEEVRRSQTSTTDSLATCPVGLGDAASQ